MRPILNTIGLLGAAILAGSEVYGRDAVPAKPNIVFILADDMNRDSWGAYGSVDCKTPHIDRLAREGLRFDRAYCSVAMCAPYRQELYSGRTPWRTGTLPNHSKSKPDTQSIVHYLEPLGYRVALAGKSHIGPQDCYPFEIIAESGDKSIDNNLRFVQAARNFMDDCTKGKEPFCLFIASHDSHAPFTTGDPSMYDADALTVPPYWLDTPELRKELVKYYAEVTNFDALVGQMRDVLEERGLWENTIFMVCSEQGIQLPFAKWTCYDNGLHLGLVARWGGVTPPGSASGELISIADITPTLVEAAGGNLQEGDVDGKSFLPMLKGEKQVLHPYVFGAFSNCNINGNRERIYPIRVIRNTSFSLIYNPNFRNQTSNTTLDSARAMVNGDSGNVPKGGALAASWVRIYPGNELVHKLHHRPEYELYHLKKDPYELKNEINNPEYQTVVEEMKKQLHARLAELGDADPIATETALVAPPRKEKKNKGKKG